MVDGEWRELLWGQLGGAIDMLENAIVACPDEVWRAGEPARALWYLTYHTLFFLFSTAVLAPRRLTIRFTGAAQRHLITDEPMLRRVRCNR